ncbi:NUDIX domain-containing protein [Candidatus Woesearchaeota archaeon]|nr:NUDIX domain-containing protein [Candidatus Woesearchaeota archaeon]
MSRDSLPYRKNCEGYFVIEDKILAKYTKECYLVFPGGGVDENEKPEDAVLRETFEETCAIIKEPIQKWGVVHFRWDKDWIKTEKQRKRFEIFQGEEMHFFYGTIEEFKENCENYEDYWEGEKLMPISKAIELIEKEKPFNENIKDYREAQLKFLRNITISPSQNS